MLAEARRARTRRHGLYAEAAERWETYGSLVERGYALLGLGRCGDAKALVEGQAIFARLAASTLSSRAPRRPQQQV